MINVITERKKCCCSVFADNNVLLALTKSSLKNILNKAQDCDIKNKIIFGISKCATHVIKLKNIIPSRHYENSISKLGMNHLPSTIQYIYLGIPFNRSSDLESIVTKVLRRLFDDLKCRKSLLVLFLILLKIHIIHEIKCKFKFDVKP
jgi:hypothetical protein